MGAPSSSFVGRVLGRYRIVGDLGAGGMARVYLARADGPGRFLKWVAIKVLELGSAEESELASMFLDEGRIAARIAHPNVVTVFDIGHDGGVYWIAMEHLRGESLRDILLAPTERGAPPLAPELAAYVAAEAAEGLHAAHELAGDDGRPIELVHRDISPHNLFVTYDGLVKVMDFGIAKAEGRLARTRAGVVKGKLAYMSPEQVSRENLDRRTDVFALGVVLWEALAYKRLFRAATDAATLERVTKGAVEPPSVHRPEIAPELDAVVLRALAKDRADRFPTARALSRQLECFYKSRLPGSGREALAAYLQAHFAERMSAGAERVRLAAAAPSDEATRPTIAVERADDDGPPVSKDRSSRDTSDPSEATSSAAAGHARSSQTDVSAASPLGATPPRARGAARWTWGLAVLLAAGGVALFAFPRRARPPTTPAPGSAAVPTDRAYLTLSCRPACATVAVDDGPAMTHEPRRLDLVPGRHKIVCDSGAARQTLWVDLPAGQETTLGVNFD